MKKINSDLAEMMRSTSAKSNLSVIVTTNGKKIMDKFKLKSIGDLDDLFTASLPPNAIKELAQLDEVISIEADIDVDALGDD